jgi:hypothetical protein
MYAIKGVYDGVSFKPREPIPVDEEYEVVITFTIPLKNNEVSERISETEKKEITKALFGILPSDIDLDEVRTKRLS